MPINLEVVGGQGSNGHTFYEFLVFTALKFWKGRSIALHRQASKQSMNSLIYTAEVSSVFLTLSEIFCEPGDSAVSFVP
jgi:hypothetical protein